MVFSAMQLFRQHGYDGTGFRDVLAHSGAPRGSIYHHFPGGKAQLGVEAVAFAGDFIAAAMDEALSADDLVEGLESFMAWWIDFLESSDFQAGCPVLAVAAESHPEAPQLAVAAATVFDLWETTLAAALRRAGVARQQARSLATLIVAAVEGAMVMCRATRDRRALVRVGTQLKMMLQGVLP